MKLIKYQKDRSLRLVGRLGLFAEGVGDLPGKVRARVSAAGPPGLSKASPLGGRCPR